MPSKSFALREGGPNEVEVAWQGNWQEVRVLHEGRLLGTIADMSTLKQGAQFRLPDGTMLGIKLHTGLSTELRLTRDGAPLPTGAPAAAKTLKEAVGLLWFLAGLNAVLGTIAHLGEVEALAAAGFGLGSIVGAVVLGGLAWLVRGRSKVALGLALVFLAIDLVLWVVLAVRSGVHLNVSALGTRIFFMAILVRGFPAITALQASESVDSVRA